MQIYDITAEVSQNLPFYSESDPFDMKRVLSMEAGDFCNLTRVTMSLHTGTHADMPLHFVGGGAGCQDVPLENFFGKAKLFRLDISPARDVTHADLAPLDIQAGDIILLDTGQSIHMQESNLKKDYKTLTTCAAEYLTQKKIRTIGIDYLSVDSYNSPDFPVHKILLSSGITVLEGLVLQGVPAGEYTISALPLKFKDGDGSPVRAVLVKY
ncbi:MAG: cyclase family protein [Defluviitaleaceae bacterium]|nr:cyclase family protein [Defluviitaleaceae bacterium]